MHPCPVFPDLKYRYFCELVIADAVIAGCRDWQNSPGDESTAKMTATSIFVEWAPNDATDKKLLDLYTHWQSLRTGNALPYRKDFRPAAIARLLPWGFLVDVLNNPRDFRFRLVGSKFLTASGQELTGRLIGEAFPPEFRKEVFEGWNTVVEKGGPNWATGTVWVKEKDFMKWQGVILPLREESGTINQLIGAAAFNFP